MLAKGLQDVASISHFNIEVTRIGRLKGALSKKCFTENLGKIPYHLTSWQGVHVCAWGCVAGDKAPFTHMCAWGCGAGDKALCMRDLGCQRY